jgi:hypothetical protein
LQHGKPCANCDNSEYYVNGLFLLYCFFFFFFFSCIVESSTFCHSVFALPAEPNQIGLRATPRVGTASRPLAGIGSAHCSQWARIHPKFLHQHHCTLPIIASFTPKIPSANLFFQPHPPNTEKARLLDSSTVLWRATPKRPHSKCLATFDEGPSIEECLQRRWWSHLSSYSAAGALPSVVGRGSWECSHTGFHREFLRCNTIDGTGTRMCLCYRSPPALGRLYSLQ